jgi:glutamate-1-semialdehyde aminotransferase
VLERVALAQQRLQCPGGQHEAEVDLAETIVQLIPSADLARIGCTGSEMVQLALRVARAATGRNLVVKFEGHYHGWLDNIFAGTTVVPTARLPRANPVHARLEALAQLLVAGLEQVGKQHGGILHVQRVGPVINTTFSPPGPIVDYRSFHASDLETQRSFLQLMEQEGVRVTGRGTWFLSSAHTEAGVELTVKAANMALQNLKV